MRFIDKHIIHCSDSEFGDVKEIRRWHKEKGWRDVGYHFVIRIDGEIELGRPLNEVGAHCKGGNLNSIGTCLIGVGNFTQTQFTSLIKIHTMLRSMFPEIDIYGHCAFSKYKTCPNFDVSEVIK